MPESLIEVTVARKRQVAEDVVSVRFEPRHGGSLPAFSPGAHIDVHLAAGLVRQYSLVSSMTCLASYEIGVLREPRSRGGSRYIHDSLEEGQVVRIRAPRNGFALDGSARRTVLLAGGIGVTPILCMADYLCRAGEDFQLHYFARNGSRAAFKERLTAERLASRVSLHLDDERRSRGVDMERLIGRFQTGAHLYVCGPLGFIETALTTATRLGWPRSSLHREYFAAARDPAPAGVERGFTVRLARSAKTLYVPPEKTLVEVMSEAGIEIAVGCSHGICGTCLTRVLQGEPEHRDSVLSDEERERNDRITPCCSRARSATLVLDL